ncbi:MAG: hypothetical protein LBU39_10995 [Desulfobulbaceae bacterium]|jgi:hypothetical protein|nr:hypothetical protein [Desulfobulbaceae bacterium]
MTDNKMQSYTDINAPYSIGFSKGQRIVLLLFSFFYLWLMSGLSYSVSINAFYDDTLQMQEGLAISQGQWLVGENIKGFASGEEWWKMNHYSHATLVKAPGFPILIALSFWTGIPLLFTMPLLWVSACLLFIHGLRPFLVRRWPLVVVFGLLLFNPMQYDASILRVYREAWNNCILLFVIAAAVGFWARVRGGGGLWLWSALLGLFLGVFWIFREEAVWIAPFLVAVAIPVAITLWLSRKNFAFPRKLIPFFLPLLLCFLIVQSICFLNWRNFGQWVTIESKSKNQVAALKLLAKAKSEHWRQYVVCPVDVREKLYAASPAFAELRAQLEGPMQAWCGFMKKHFGINEFGNYFMWALRESMLYTGHYKNATEADAYYGRLASELRQAYADGVVEEEPGMVFGGLGQPFNSKHLPTFWKALGKGVDFLFLSQWSGPATYPTFLMVGKSMRGIDRDTAEDLIGAKLPETNGWHRRDLRIAGWCVEPGQGEPCTLDVEENNYGNLSRGWPGHIVASSILEQVVREDVRRNLTGRGVNYAPTLPEGFTISVPQTASSPQGMQLRITAADGRVGHWNIAQNSWFGKSLSGVLLNIDSVHENPPSGVREDSDRFRRDILGKIGGLYVMCTKSLTFFVLIGAMVAIAYALLKKRFSILPLPWLTLSLFGLVFTRIALLSILEACAGPGSIRMMYMSPAWVGLYGACAAFLVWLCEWRRRGAGRVSLFL